MTVIGVSPGNTDTGGSLGSGCGAAIETGTSGVCSDGGTVASVRGSTAAVVGAVVATSCSGAGAGVVVVVVVATAAGFTVVGAAWGRAAVEGVVATTGWA